MKSLLKSVRCPQENHIQKEIGGYFGYPDAGSVEKIPEKHINENRKGNKKENETGYGGAYRVECLYFAVNGRDPVFSQWGFLSSEKADSAVQGVDPLDSTEICLFISEFLQNIA